MQLSHKPGLLCAAALAALLLAPRPAQALDFTFTFTTNSGSTGGAGQTVAGTISGLMPGMNAGTGLTATVTTAPNNDFVGDTFSFATTNTAGDAFTVSPDGTSVTYAEAVFADSTANSLTFGSSPGKDSYFPELNGYPDGPTGSVVDYKNISAPDTFAPASVAVPEPSTLAPFALAALCLLGLTLRARRQKNAA